MADVTEDVVELIRSVLVEGYWQHSRLVDGSTWIVPESVHTRISDFLRQHDAEKARKKEIAHVER